MLQEFLLTDNPTDLLHVYGTSGNIYGIIQATATNQAAGLYIIGHSGDESRLYDNASTDEPIDTTLDKSNNMSNFLESIYQLTPPKLPNINLKDALSMRSMLSPLRKHGTKGLTDFIKIAPMMMPEMMDEWFENSLLRGALSSIGIYHSSLGPFAASTGYNFLHQHLYSNGIIHPNTFIKGGTLKFAEVLQNISKSYNVEFRINAKVKSIKLDNEFCKGVVLENGDKIESNIVVSGVDPKNTFINLVGSPNLNPNFRTQVRNIKYRGSIARMHFLLKDLPKIHEIPKENMATMFSICPNIEYLERASDSMKYGCLADNPFISFCFPTLINPDFSSSGNHILSSTIQYVPYRLRKQKWGSETNEVLKQITTKTLEKFIPGFNKLIESCTIYSPKDLEDEFGLSEGNLNHGEMTLDQFMFMRPTISTSQYKTPIASDIAVAVSNAVEQHIEKEAEEQYKEYQEDPIDYLENMMGLEVDQFLTDPDDDDNFDPRDRKILVFKFGFL